jgi:HAD superfamily hydrolase (TIGR01549 family)
MKYTGLLIDLDDTLIITGNKYGPILRNISNGVAKQVGVDPDLLFETTQKEMRNLKLTMSSSPLAYNRAFGLRNALDKLKIKYTLKQIAEVQELFWEQFTLGIDVYDHVYEVLLKLRNNGVKIVVVSDGDWSLRIRKMKSAKLLEYVDDLVSSEEAIFEKPFSSIFNMALERIGKKREEVIMLGNDLVKDVHGGQQVGIRSGLFKPKENAYTSGMEKIDIIKPDFIIENYLELLTEFGI